MAREWPAFTHTQVSFLEEAYPARPINRRESIEDHLRYAGMVELIARMRETVLDAPVVIGKEAGLDLTEEELEAADEALAVQIATTTER